MGPKSVLGAVATVLMLTLPAAAQAPADPPAMHERGMGERAHWSGHHWRGHFARHHGRWGRPVIALTLRHQQELGLSPAQVESLERLRTDFMRDAIRQRADQKLARLDLAALLRPDPADPAKPVDLAKVEAKIREIERMKADRQVARFRTIEAGKALLTVDQRAKLAALLTQSRWRGRRPDGPPLPRQD